MFKFNKTVSSAVLGAAVVSALAILSTSAFAGLDFINEKSEASAGKQQTKPTKVESMARIPDKTPANSFKCWQEGRLIFQRTGLEVKKQKLPGAALIKTNGKTVQVLDLKQGVCILDQEVK